jgi:hypothetical protein
MRIAKWILLCAVLGPHLNGCKSAGVGPQTPPDAALSALMPGPDGQPIPKPFVPVPGPEGRPGPAVTRADYPLMPGPGGQPTLRRLEFLGVATP